MGGRVSKDLKKKSQLAWGLCLICVFFLLETWNANRVHPNAATPLVWGALGLLAIGAAGFALVFAHKSKRSGTQESAEHGGN